MTPGLPGTGIGGLFYVLSALLMPIVALARCARRRRTGVPWRLIAGQWAMVFGILAALAAQAWLLGKVVEGLDALRLRLSHSYASSWAGLLVGDGAPSAPAANAALSMTIYLSLSTLLGVLLAVHVLRLALRTVAKLRFTAAQKSFAPETAPSISNTHRARPNHERDRGPASSRSDPLGSNNSASCPAAIACSSSDPHAEATGAPLAMVFDAE